MTDDTVESMSDLPAQRAGRREWIGLAVIALPTIVYTMDLTLRYLAVPALIAAMALLAVLPVIFGLKQIAIEEFGWLPGATIVAGLGLGALFVRRQGRPGDPLVDLNLFASRAFSGALVTSTLALTGAIANMTCGVIVD